MMMGTDKFLNDDELDKLLATASTPVIPHGFEARFASRLRQTPGPSNVVAFPQKKVLVQRKAAPWPLAAALAASLVIGFWLSGDTRVNNLLDDNADVAMNASTAVHDFGPAGFDDLTSIELGSQS
ncbi:hypothetical protein [Aestuariivirga litoralis]|uniref:hypothetical protein n=1 Tax=Aestuariivirga litoralis TaxID=2650924 RepID=UPI0018C77A45|nr:hypothetical protein [Aestuariivirga litoralis]MBG1232206.1 hypothetical protein [Aestuariivirga litoralis]